MIYNELSLLLHSFHSYIRSPHVKDVPLSYIYTCIHDYMIYKISVTFFLKDDYDYYEDNEDGNGVTLMLLHVI